MKITNRINEKVAKKILEPYLERLLRSCYKMRVLALNMPFEKWCEKVNEDLKKGENV